MGDLNHAAWLHGLKIVAVAVVAQAVWGMARNLCPDRERATVAVGAALLALAVPSAAGQVGAIIIGALIGWRLFRGGARRTIRWARWASGCRGRSRVGSLVAFVVLLVGLQAAAVNGSHLVQLFNAFYRSGSLVFGGGHVVLPLLQRAVVRPAASYPVVSAEICSVS